MKWEYCEVDFDGSWTYAWFYDEAGAYIEHPIKHKRLGILIAQLGHDGWEIISSWRRSEKQVTYILKRPFTGEWTEANRKLAQEKYQKNHPRD